MNLLEKSFNSTKKWKARAEDAEADLKKEQSHSWQFLRRAEDAEKERDALAADLEFAESNVIQLAKEMKRIAAELERNRTWKRFGLR